MGIEPTTVYSHKINLFIYEASRGAAARRDCKTDWLRVRSPLEDMKHLLTFIFPFLRSSVEVKRGVEFWHSARNAGRIRQKVENGVS